MIGRRRFIALASAVWALPARVLTQTSRVALATYSHIDVAWRWPLAEGLQQSDSTFRSVLRVLDAFPQLKFSGTSGSYYAWVRETDPSTFAAIAEKVHAGQWEPVGGWWTEADVNIVSGESLMRQAYFGQREFEQHLGVRTEVAFLPDSFGSSANLPAILRASGFRYYVMGRGTFDGEPPPRGAFLWHSLGDASIVTYNDPVNGGTNDAVKTVTSAAHLQDGLLVWFGLGDHGGGPTIESLQALQAFLATPAAPTVTFTEMDTYLRAVPRPQIERSGEIEGVFPGAYTNAPALKRSFIDAERALIDCERFDVLASFCGVERTQPELDDLWQTLLLNQHHDTISATGPRENIDLALAQNRSVAERAADVTLPILASIANRIENTPANDAMIVVFNPLPYPVRELIEYPISASPGNVPKLFDANGQPVTAQPAASAGAYYAERAPVTCFMADLPAFGYAAFHAMGTQSAKSLAAGDPLEALPAIRLAVFADHGDTWGSDGLDAGNVFGVFDQLSSSIVERGPVRSVLECTLRFRASHARMRIERRTGERITRYTIDLEWNEPFMRAALILDEPGSEALYDVPFGVVRRKASTSIQPGYSFVARERAAGGLLALVSCGNHGFWASDKSLGLTLVRSTPFSELGNVYVGPDDLQGIGTYRIAAAVAECDNVAALRQAGERFERSFPAIWNGVHDGAAPPAASFATLSPSVLMPSIRRVDAGVEIRIHNADGLAGHARLAVGGAAYDTNLDPFGIRTLQLRNGRIKDITPH